MCAIARRTGLAACLMTHTTRVDAIAALTGEREERCRACGARASSTASATQADPAWCLAGTRTWRSPQWPCRTRSSR